MARSSSQPVLSPALLTRTYKTPRFKSAELPPIHKKRTGLLAAFDFRSIMAVPPATLGLAA
ncbi:hypothetical protein D3C78_1882660 [compost metagenome]